MKSGYKGHVLKDKIYRLVKAHTKLAMAACVILAAELIAIALLIASANTPVPSLPQYPGTYRYDVPWPSNSSERKPDANIRIRTSGEPVEVDRTYSFLMGSAGWGEPRTCYSGIPGSRTWHHAGSGLFEQEGWTARVEYQPATSGMTDIDVSIWKGPMSVVICGEM